MERKVQAIVDKACITGSFPDDFDGNTFIEDESRREIEYAGGVAPEST